MSNLHIVVDGDVLMDGDLGIWTQKPPAELLGHFRPGAKPQPWMKALMIAVAEAAVTNQPLRADVRTHPTGWSMTVEMPMPKDTHAIEGHN
ncbi:hypothetical protein MSP7336_01813 [Mycobacterium shimoidei]|uniref:Uncharacterized protein n=1 Tax=Mycobacterium shimoidei TaxID=29313 RepID=A0A375YXF5_MYCSH|nr:MFS transporter [Mycobacterium shimoidei]SRX93574.1 hypothetical protein MSP7336_01813 [Mycobacterium shimoidei]